MFIFSFMYCVWELGAGSAEGEGRQARCNVENKLEPFVEGRTDEFIEWANEEAKRLSSAGTKTFLSFFFALDD